MSTKRSYDRIKYNMRDCFNIVFANYYVCVCCFSELSPTDKSRRSLVLLFVA